MDNNTATVEINNVVQLMPFKDKFQRAIMAAAFNALDENYGWFSIDQIIEECQAGGEGFDIDLLCPAMQAAGIPDSNEYDVWTAGLGSEGHHIVYSWAAEALAITKEVISLRPEIRRYRKLQNPELY